MLAGPASDALTAATAATQAAPGGADRSVSQLLAAVIVVIAPIARPAVVRYDVVVQPIGTSQLAVSLETASGDVQQQRALDVSDGWSGTTGTVETTGSLPLHWTFVGSPDDRLVVDGFPLDARVIVDVNGERTETAAGPATVRSLRELGAPVSRLDRAVLAASWLADVVLLLARGAPSWASPDGGVDAARRRRTGERRPDDRRAETAGVLRTSPRSRWRSGRASSWCSGRA